MREFKNYHPFVNFFYFMAVIVFSMLIRHPLSIAVSLFCSLSCSVVLDGFKIIKTFLKVILPLVILSALINPVFVHEGETVLMFFPNGEPITLEAITYGLTSGIMIASAVLWFSCYNEIITNDKIIYLFGKIMPSISLMLSMVLRFVPRFKEQARQMMQAQYGMGKSLKELDFKNKIRFYMEIFSAMITWGLEGSIETASSMKNRGYGLKGRTSFSIFKITLRDIGALIFVLIMAVYVIVGYILGRINFAFYPQMIGAENTIYSYSIFVAYFLLCIMPIMIEAWEELKWKYLRSRI